MKQLHLDLSKALNFIDRRALDEIQPVVSQAHHALEDGSCPGNDFLGWLHLPSSITPGLIDDIADCAQTLRSLCEVIVVAGIGGSYLGARAVIDALADTFRSSDGSEGNPAILYAGNNISEDYLAELTRFLENKKFGVINISKSGTTTETALAFRLLKRQCEAQRGKETARRVIVAITDAEKGAARQAARKEGYRSFVIPDNV